MRSTTARHAASVRSRWAVMAAIAGLVERLDGGQQRAMLGLRRHHARAIDVEDRLRAGAPDAIPEALDLLGQRPVGAGRIERRVEGAVALAELGRLVRLGIAVHGGDDAPEPGKRGERVVRRCLGDRQHLEMRAHGDDVGGV